MGFDLSTLASLLKADSPNSSKEGVLGIDIGSSAIKVIQLSLVKDIPTLQTYGELQLGPYENIDSGRGTHLPPARLIEALVDILREAGASARTVAFSLSYNSCLTTTIKIPLTEEEKLGTVIPVEARKFIPVSLSKVDLSWFPLEIDPVAKTMSVLVSAIYVDAQKRYLAIMEGCGLRTVGSEIEVFSMIRSTLSPQDEVVAILDFGATSTRFCIIRKGVIVKTHSILLSGVEVTSELAKALSVEFKEAEEIKRKFGLRGKVDDPRIQKSVVSTMERGLREMHTVLKRYEQTEGIEIQKVILSGSGALLSGIDTYVHDMFTRPAETAHPFAKVAYPAFLEDTLVQAGPTFAPALGIALRALQS